MKLAVWLARLILGGTFIVSGVSKMIDPYGIQIKIDAYLAAWNLSDYIPQGLVLVGGCALALFEFVVGILLFTGSLRRSAAYLATAIMTFMLPLTIYIAIKNPVDDCGCFGDFLILSNQITMWKNVVLYALALFLCKYNRRVRWLFAPWIQWVQVAAGVVYMLLIAFAGYHNQPLLDFRAYPVGEPLYDDGSDPDSGKMLAVIDRESGEDVTEEVVGITPGQMILLMPEPAEAGASGSYVVNELQQAVESRFGAGSFIAITAADSEAVERAMDLMMATYPVYYADSKAISAIARGSMAVVYLRNGVVSWKRTLNSINLDRLGADANLAEIYAINGTRRFKLLTALYLAANIVIFGIGLLPYIGRLRRRRAPQSPASKEG